MCQFPRTTGFRRDAHIRVVLFEPAEEIRSESRVEAARRSASQDVSCEHECEWRAQEDDFKTFLDGFAAAFPRNDFP